MKTARLRVARLRQERVHRSRQVIHAAPRHRRHENQKRTADARRTARRTARRRVVSCRIRIERPPAEAPSEISPNRKSSPLPLLDARPVDADARPRRSPSRRTISALRDTNRAGLRARPCARGGGARGGVSSRPRVPGDATRVALGSGRRAALEPTHASVLDERPRDARRVLRARRATRLGGGGGRYGRSESIPRAGQVAPA